MRIAPQRGVVRSSTPTHCPKLPHPGRKLDLYQLQEASAFTKRARVVDNSPFSALSGRFVRMGANCNNKTGAKPAQIQFHSAIILDCRVSARSAYSCRYTQKNFPKTLPTPPRPQRRFDLEEHNEIGHVSKNISLSRQHYD